jgi:hypothetical protein
MNVFDVYAVLSFDVYNMLIDFEQRILGVLKPIPLSPFFSLFSVHP